MVIGLFFLLIYHLTKTALETVDPFNTYICVGVISMITFHVFQNIGMTIQVLPITGIPLPFISYGGSSLMGNMLAMGPSIAFIITIETICFLQTVTTPQGIPKALKKTFNKDSWLHSKRKNSN